MPRKSTYLLFWCTIYYTKEYTFSDITNVERPVSPTLGQLLNSTTANTTNITSITSHTITNTHTQAETNAITNSNATTDTDATGSKWNNRMGKRVGLSLYGIEDVELTLSEFRLLLSKTELSKLCGESKGGFAIIRRYRYHSSKKMGVQQKNYALCSLFWHGMEGKLLAKKVTLQLLSQSQIWSFLLTFHFWVFSKTRCCGCTATR